MATPEYFADLNSDVTKNKKPFVLLDDDALKQQIKNVLTTLRGSEEWDVNFGSNVPLFLHEPQTENTAKSLRSSILSALNNQLKNLISVNKGGIRVNPLTNERGYYVDIIYRRRDTGAKAQYKFNLV